MSDNLYEAFGRRLSAARRQAQLTQSEVARRVGMSRASIANIEAGKQRVFLDQIYEFAQGIGVESLGELLPSYSLSGDSPTALVLTGATNLSREQERTLSDILRSATQS